LPPGFLDELDDEIEERPTQPGFPDEDIDETEPIRPLDPPVDEEPQEP
jgi:hypothetical protein